MQRFFAVVIGLVLLGMAASAYAELQNVEVGGEIRIRGRYYRNVVHGNPAGGFLRRPIITDPILGSGVISSKRPMGPFGITSYMAWDEDGEGLALMDQWTRLHVKADFTDDVVAFIEFDATDVWGTDFRSQDYITGVDNRPVSTDDVEVFQAYIEANEMFGYPLRLRIGRQAMTFGKGFLVSDHWSPVAGTSFDAIRLTYEMDNLCLDAWWSKLAERSPVEEDGDIDFYGVYATYTGMEALSVSGYWMLLRDAIAVPDDTVLGFIGEWWEGLFGLDDYDPTYLHTIGLRAWGKAGGFDYDAEVAYQFGEADSVGSLYPMRSWWGVYGDEDADWDNWAADIEAGYSFDTAWSPRVFLGLRWFEGEDNRDISFWDWVNPFYRGEASVSFNRLFAECNVCPVMFDNNYGSNYWELRGGVVVKPTEKLSAKAELEWYEADETAELPLTWRIGNMRIARPISVIFPWITEESDSELGVSANLWLYYHYSEDLFFLFLWQHLFVDDGLEDGNYTRFNGHDLSGGTSDDDADLWSFMATIKF